ncbi:MAG: hypothetical protein AAF376_18440 [Pseudomonadota bacterium]
MRTVTTRVSDDLSETLEPYSGAARDTLIICRDLAHRMEVSNLRHARIDYQKGDVVLVISMKR